MNYNKDRIKELFTKLDRKNAGVLPRNKFIDAITNTSMGLYIQKQVSDHILQD